MLSIHLQRLCYTTQVSAESYKFLRQNLEETFKLIEKNIYIYFKSQRCEVYFLNPIKNEYQLLPMVQKW